MTEPSSEEVCVGNLVGESLVAGLGDRPLSCGSGAVTIDGKPKALAEGSIAPVAAGAQRPHHWVGRSLAHEGSSQNCTLNMASLLGAMRCFVFGSMMTDRSGVAVAA